MPARKQQPSQAEQEQVLADMIVKASNSFEHVGMDRIGVPPMEADAKKCKGHSWKDFCTICRFNFCQVCGDPLSHFFRTHVDSAFWAGNCGYHAHAAPPAHHARVLQLVDQAMGGLAVAPEQAAAPMVRQVARKAAAAPKVAKKAAAAPKVTKKAAAAPKKAAAPQAVAPKKAKTWSVSEHKLAMVAARAAEAGSSEEYDSWSGEDHDAAPPIVPQINIAIAPLAELRVESTDTAVRRIGNTRFEITVTVVLGQ